MNTIFYQGFRVMVISTVFLNQINVFMKFLCLFLLLLPAGFCFSQYYYNDIIAPQQAQAQNMLLKKNNIKKVTATSIENDNAQGSAFKIDQDILQNGDVIITNSTDAAGINTYTKSNFSNSKIIRNVDSNSNVVTTVSYRYDNTGKLLNITSVTNDAFMNSHLEEQHQWFYNAEKPSYMLRVKDGKDTTRIEFVYDENGNLGEEKWMKKNYTLEHWYYYYDNAGRLTDIVRFNLKAKKMLPDFLFEYDAAGKLVQTTQVPSGISSYLIWKYAFDDKGLKTNETCYNKQKQVVGKIVYSYQ